MIRVRMFGQVGLASENGNAAVCTLLDHPKRLALLLYLARKPGQLHQRDVLELIFWPEADQQQAGNALRQAIHVLRSAVGKGVVLSRRGGGVGVDPELVSSDVIDFERAVMKGQHEQACSRYDGDFLSGFYVTDEPMFERWVETQRTHLRRMACDSAENVARRLEGEERRDLALKYYRIALDLAPHSERIAARLIWLLGQLGNRAEAWDEYVAFANRLEREVGFSPSSTTQNLMHNVVGLDPSPRRPPLDGNGFVSLPL